MSADALSDGFLHRARRAGTTRQPSWNQTFHTGISTIKMAAFLGPRNITALRLATDHAIPRRVLPKNLRISEIEFANGVTGEWYTPVVTAVVPPKTGAASPASPQAAPLGRVILYLHGGAFVLCSPGTHRFLLSQLATKCQARVLSVR